MQDIYRKLLTYAYNIVGSYDDAKDMVQDVLEKYISLDKTNVRDEKNYLIKSVINHSINFKNKQNKKGVFGEWLPEPVSADNPDIKLIREQTANYSLLVLMEHLNAKERAVFILKEGFDYTHSEIAELLSITVDNSRQVLSRASKQLQNASFHSGITSKGIDSDVIRQYQKAITNADRSQLEILLVDDIKLTADGGKKVRVVRAVEVGKTATVTLLSYVQQQFLSGKKHTFHTFNHQSAICFWNDNVVYNCHILEIDESGKIKQIYSIVDPEKLKNIP